MKAITGKSKRYMELVEEYRVALGLWSEARALYPVDSLEVQRATEHLEVLEYNLSHVRAGTVAELDPALEAQR